MIMDAILDAAGSCSYECSFSHEININLNELGPEKFLNDFL